MSKARDNRMERYAQTYRSLEGMLKTDTGKKWLEVSGPNAIANFVAFCKLPLKDDGIRVRFRGESKWHDRLEPSLFRGCSTTDERKQRFGAYQDLVARLPNEVRGTRFTKADFGAVLQHYGLRTPWIDVVDDLSTAIWFSLNEYVIGNGEAEYDKSGQSGGWILFVACDNSSRLCDLREEHSSRNARCHAQQASSIARQGDDGELHSKAHNLSDLVIARVRIPNKKKWRLDGFRASQHYLFPPTALDSTYNKLQTEQVTQLVQDVEQEYGLPENALGRIAQYSEPESEGE